MEDEKVYKVVELVGSSPTSWEDAIHSIVAKASKSIRDLRIVEVIKLDVRLEDDKVKAFRAKVNLSFKLEED
ncbi:MAG: dodecin domain-containing protein [Candidatus Heimdallarchaeota archaeon]|nr:dodecin domain-containing protein [Candidatus Heimdallarchaeota archaeon]MCK4877873.1 dodecin domain-containing protein [Candidatus Heimdallarchaeota archaeon]